MFPLFGCTLLIPTKPESLYGGFLTETGMHENWTVDPKMSSMLLLYEAAVLGVFRPASLSRWGVFADGGSLHLVWFFHNKILIVLHSAYSEI